MTCWAIALVLLVLQDADCFNLNKLVDDSVGRSAIDTLLMFDYYDHHITTKIPTIYFTSTSNLSKYQVERQTLSIVNEADEEYFSKFASKRNVKHVFILQNATRDYLQGVFETCWKFKIIYVLAIINESVFTYSAFENYPNLKIFDADIDYGFPEMPSDFQNFPLKIGSKFPITKGWDFYGILELFGVNKNMNISYHKFDNETTVDFLKMNVIPKELESTYEKAGFSQFVSFIAALPNRPLMNKTTFILLPFDAAVWFGITFGALYFSLIFWIVSRGRADIMESILAALSLTLQQSINVNFKLPVKLHVIVLIYTVYSFVIVTLHSMYLGSFLVKNTGRAQGTITCHYIIYDTFVQFNSSILKKYKFVRTTHEETKESFARLDTRHGYCMDSAFFDSFNNFQKYLESPLFLKETSDYTEPCTYAMNRRFILKDVLNKFLRRLYYSGLFGKLLISDLNTDMVKTLVANSKKSSGSNESTLLVASDFILVAIAFGICLGLTALVFLIECAFHKYVN